jgi:2-methylcitrate dehydratase PrpD
MKQAIDTTPTWSDILPALVAVIEDSNAIGKTNAIKELEKMAAVADKYVEYLKKGN